MKELLLLLLSLLQFALLACEYRMIGPGLNEFPFQNLPYDSIINGNSVGSRMDSISKSVVAVELLDANNKTLFFCSGVLIGPNSVLTAAHCLGSTDQGVVADFRVVFENRYYGVRRPRTLEGAFFVSHPKYNTEIATIVLSEEEKIKYNMPDVSEFTSPAYNHDVAIGVFSGVLPSGFAPIEVQKDNKSDLSGAIIDVFGYGRSIDYEGTHEDENLGLTVGFLRKGKMKIEKFTQFQDRFYAVTTSSNNYVCQGDSGGGAFISLKGKKPRLLGITSSSWGPLLKNGQRSCKSFSQFTNAASVYDWIKSEEKNLLLKLKEYTNAKIK